MTWRTDESSFSSSRKRTPRGFGAGDGAVTTKEGGMRDSVVGIEISSIWAAMLGGDEGACWFRKGDGSEGALRVATEPGRQ